MPIANWKTQSHNLVQSLLFANPHRVIRMLVRNEKGERQERVLEFLEEMGGGPRGGVI